MLLSHVSLTISWSSVFPDVNIPVPLKYINKFENIMEENKIPLKMI